MRYLLVLVILMSTSVLAKPTEVGSLTVLCPSSNGDNITFDYEGATLLYYSDGTTKVTPSTGIVLNDNKLHLMHEPTGNNRVSLAVSKGNRITMTIRGVYIQKTFTLVHIPELINVGYLKSLAILNYLGSKKDYIVNECLIRENDELAN